MNPGIGSAFIRDDLHRHATHILCELLLTAAGLSGKLVSSPPPWFSHDISADSLTLILA